MARLYEHEGKDLLDREGIPIPQGSVAHNPQEAGATATQIGTPVAVKAQIRAGGRGKSGGIRFADTAATAAETAGELLESSIRGIPVTRVLVEEKLEIEEELYVGIIVDGSQSVRAPTLIIGSQGGVDVEDIEDQNLAVTPIDVLIGLPSYQALDTARRAGIDRPHLRAVAEIATALYRVFERHECRSIEINPLAVTRTGHLVAADCRAAIDDAAVHRHPDLGIEVARDTDREPCEFDRIAWSIEKGDLRGTGYVAEMSQDIDAVATVGYHGIGGGGAILGVDALNRSGLRVANYADTSGNPPASKVYRVAKLILSRPDIDGYCLGGFIMANQEQWHHAHGLVKAFREELPQRPGFPTVVLLCGNREEEALEILRRGTEDLPARIEIYGHDHVYDTGFIANRLRSLVDQYLEEGSR
jgi:succinyl-CoA synthetase beta subunit